MERILKKIFWKKFCKKFCALYESKSAQHQIVVTLGAETLAGRNFCRILFITEDLRTIQNMQKKSFSE